MQSFSSWTTQQIREGGFCVSWIEERLYEWITITARAINNIVNAHTYLVLTDSDREWLESYLINKINKKGFSRPPLPVISLKSIYPHIDSLNSSDDIELLNDMLSILFPNGYSFFYVGDGTHKRAKIAKAKDDSLLWLFDERVQNSLYLSSNDRDIDIKLMQLVDLFDKSVDVILFNEVDIEGAI